MKYKINIINWHTNKSSNYKKANYTPILLMSNFIILYISIDKKIKEITEKVLQFKKSYIKMFL